MFPESVFSNSPPELGHIRSTPMLPGTVFIPGFSETTFNTVLFMDRQCFWTKRNSQQAFNPGAAFERRVFWVKVLSLVMSPHLYFQVIPHA